MAVRRPVTALPPTLNPLEAFKMFANVPSDIPDVIEFTMSDKYLNRPNLYPRQGTLLKVIFLQEHLLTEYDHQVLNEWEESYLKTADDKGEGNRGIVPGVRERMRINSTCPCGHHVSEHHKRAGQCSGGLCSCGTYRGRRWFREVVSVIGRRGSKGHVGAIAGAYVLWHYITKGDPQGYYGVDRDKRLTGIVFAGKKEQAKVNQWKDLTNVILGAPCFSQYISRPQTESLSLFSRYDFVKMAERASRGIHTDVDQASFVILPAESTTMAGRGPASFMQFYDEVAHVVKGVAKNEATDVYDAATPSLDQFGLDGFIYLPSSPWQKIGLFYDKYQEAIETEEDGTAVYPEMLMVQLTSWDPYEDWERAHEIPRAPGELPYQRLKGAIQSYDHQMQQLERANPDTFKVERRSRFATVLDAYLNPEKVKTIWEPWNGKTLTLGGRGNLATTYRAHGDPSKSGAGFGFALAHVEGPDERGLPHVVFDELHAWLPENYEGHEVDYDDIKTDLADYLDRYMPHEMTFDQFNSVATIQALQRHARAMRYPKQVQIYERTATGPLNWKTYETFKTALGLGLIHAPYFELADLELTFLQDLGGKVEHPTSGPVQTKDVADCMAIVTYELIGEQMTAFIGKMLSEVPLGVGAQGGLDPYGPQREEAHQALSAFGRGRGPGGPRGMGAPRRRR